MSETIVVKKINGLELYLTDTGAVFTKEGARVKQFPNENGYLLVQLYEGSRPYSVHRLVAKYFYPKEYGDGTNIEIHHRDKNKLNNRADNLEVIPKEEHRKTHTGVDIKAFMYDLTRDLNELSIYALIYEMTHNEKAPFRSLRVAFKCDYEFIRTRLPHITNKEIDIALEGLEDKKVIINNKKVYITLR